MEKYGFALYDRDELIRANGFSILRIEFDLHEFRKSDFPCDYTLF